MKAEALIKDYRQTHERLMKLQTLYNETNGEQGLACFNYDELVKQVNYTDAEILDILEQRGFYIADKEEYLATKKEKTN